MAGCVKFELYKMWTISGSDESYPSVGQVYK
jgi:hypothetical protein